MFGGLVQQGRNQIKIQIKKKWNEFSNPNQYNQNQNQNQGWGGNQGNNNGWGNQGKNNGWGNQGGNNNGWGNQGGNNGWGNQGGNNNGGNNGWGQGGNNNNGWQGQGGNGGNLFQQGLNAIHKKWNNHNFQMINNNNNNTNFINDIKNVLEQQIVYLQPSPSEKILEQLRRSGKVFNDQRFPPNLKSLSGQWGNLANWRDIKWAKISEVIKNPEIIVGKIEPNDIKQGYLGDCYFLAAIAALAEREDRIMNLFLVNKVNPQKYFSVKMLYKGKWMTIDMDEYIPSLNGSPAFSKSVDKELWVILLEKAWAKMYTSFKRIQAGYPQEGLHDLTGAPIRQIIIQGQNFRKDEQFRYLEEASRKGYAMVTSSQPGSDTNKSFTGVVLGHAYTFLKAVTVNCQGNACQIVKLRNPWGKSEPHGDWRDDDQKWKYVSQQERRAIGFGTKADDGVFFMSWNDFVKQFRAITVAEIDDNASYVYKSFKDPQNKGCYFRVEILKEGQYSFQIDKTPERSYPDKVQDSFRYPQALFDIGEFQGGSVKKMQGCASASRTLFKRERLRPGVYICKAKIDYDKRFQKQFDVNLAVYGQYVCKIELASNKEAVALEGRQVDWVGEISKDKEVTPDSWNNLGNLDWGNNAHGFSQWGNQGGSDWGNQGNQGNQGGNGWGNQGNQGGNGWGNQGNQGGSGWGNQGNQGGNGWGNQGNQGGNGWGNQGNQGGNGWGNQGSNQGGNNDGWGGQNVTYQQGNKNPLNQQGNSGWGNQNLSNQQGNNGWGNQNPNQQGNNGWGNQNSSNQQGNNGWGNQNNSNNGW